MPRLPVGQPVRDNNQKVIKMAKKKKRNKSKYTDKFKQEVVAYRQNHTITETAERFHVPKGTVSTWARGMGASWPFAQEAETPPPTDDSDVLLKVAQLALLLRKEGHALDLKVELYGDIQQVTLAVKL